MALLLHYLLLSLAVKSSIAHPGHSVADEAAERAEFFKFKPRSVRSCSGTLSTRGYAAEGLQRRKDFANNALKSRGLKLKRDFATYNSSHESTENVVFGDDELLLFSDNSSCILQPEVTQGPYFVDGETIRSNVTEGQTGVPLYLEIQFVDTASCQPVPAAYIDLWHANSTGVYSGVSASGNGVGENDTSNLDATFLRGIQQTDINGIVQFETIFPGHYTGRATHIHIMSHQMSNTTIRTNSTILGTNGTVHASHVGQIFFDQDLISLVETVEPYVDNSQDITLNSDDSILAEETDSMDPFVNYLLLGDDVADGILAWISIGIDSSADNEVQSAATIYENGGEAHDSQMGPGGGNGGPGNGTNGTVPSGSMPAGTKSAAPSTSA